MPTLKLTKMKNYDTDDLLGNDCMLPDYCARRQKKNRKFLLLLVMN